MRGWSQVMLALGAMACSAEGTYLVVRVVGTADRRPVARLEVSAELEGRTAERVVTSIGEGGLRLPSTLGFEVVRGDGPVVVVALAFDAAGAAIASARGDGVVKRGASSVVELALEATPDAGADGAPADAAVQGHNLVFVTSTRYPATLGGPAGGDAFCQQRAEYGGRTGTFRAWLSTAAEAARDRLKVPGTSTEARGFVRPDGAPVGHRIGDLVAGRILNPISLDESGGRLPNGWTFWTGTEYGMTSGRDCGGWTVNSGSATFGYINTGTTLWSTGGSSTTGCTTMRSLLCFQVDHDGPAPVVPAGALEDRRVFVTRGLLQPGPAGGIAGADALCAREAGVARLGGTFRALLSTTQDGAASRVGLTVRYRRIDGVLVAVGAQIEIGSELRSGIWQYADGEYAYGLYRVWTGSTQPAGPGTADQTCGDWLDAGRTGALAGFAAYTDDDWWSANSWSCDEPLPIYCVEQ